MLIVCVLYEQNPRNCRAQCMCLCSLKIIPFRHSTNDSLSMHIKYMFTHILLCLIFAHFIEAFKGLYTMPAGSHSYDFTCTKWNILLPIQIRYKLKRYAKLTVGRRHTNGRGGRRLVKTLSSIASKSGSSYSLPDLRHDCLICSYDWGIFL